MSYCHYIHHNFHVYWHGVEPGPTKWGVCKKPSEPWHSLLTIAIGRNLQAMKAWACIRSSVRRLPFPSYRTPLRCSACTASHWNRGSCVLMSYNCVTKSVVRQAAFSFQLLSLDSPPTVICPLECTVKRERHTKFLFQVNLVLRVERRLHVALRQCNTALPTDRQI